MTAMLMNFVQKHTPPVISIIFTLLIATFYLGQTVNDGFNAVKKDLITEARLPAYAIILASLDKQIEKINKDPDDVKSADVKFLYNQCNSDFGRVFLTGLPPNQSLTAYRTCEMLEEIYMNRRPF